MFLQRSRICHFWGWFSELRTWEHLCQNFIFIDGYQINQNCVNSAFFFLFQNWRSHRPPENTICISSIFQTRFLYAPVLFILRVWLYKSVIASVFTEFTLVLFMTYQSQVITLLCTMFENAFKTWVHWFFRNITMFENR